MMPLPRPALLLALSLAHAAAFLAPGPALRPALSGPQSLACSASKSTEGAAAPLSRRAAAAAIAFGAGSLLAGSPLGARAAGKDDDDDDVGGGQGAQQREVTYEADDKVCEAHPKWKQCRKKKGAAKGPETAMANGIKYKEVSVGKGIVAQPGDTVTVHYSLFYNGDEIESSRESSGLAAAPLGFQFGVKSGYGSVIPAINAGIDGMRVGGVRRVIAPPELAFGEKGKKPRIPPGATVEFDLQLLTVKRAGTNPISSQGKGAEKNTGLFDLF